jgi:hypothetical protein
MKKRETFDAEPDSIQFIPGDGGDVILIFDYVRIPESPKNVRLTLKIPANQVDEFADRIRAKSKESLERALPN